MRVSTVIAALAIALAPMTSRAAEPAYGPELQGFDYPWPVSHFRFTSQGDALDMAYMDVKPAQPNGRTVVLLHGKNFCAATWQATIAVLTQAGYRVIAPDQIGFCKSTKPRALPVHLSAARRKHPRAAGLARDRQGDGHGPFDRRHAGDPLRADVLRPMSSNSCWSIRSGWRTGRPRASRGRASIRWYQQELHTSADRIRDYERTTYYAGTWKPEYEKWVQMLAGLNRGPGHQVVAWNSALIYDMIYTQPVVYELGDLTMPVLLMIGDKDTTAIGKNFAPPAIRPTLGNYPVLGKAAAARIPHATLVEFPDLGHAPQIQDPEVVPQGAAERPACLGRSMRPATIQASGD